MELFNKNGEHFNIPTDTYIIKRGCFGTVRKLDDKTCVKLFDYETGADVKLLEEIKNIHLHHFDSLKEILYDENGNLKAYLMPIYNRDLPDYYSMEAKDFIRRFRSLYKDVLELTDRKIYIDDAKYRNTMNYKDTLKMIDYDFYYYSKSPKLLYYNVGALLRLWMEIFLVQRKRNGYTDLIKDSDIFYFFNPEEYKEDRILDILDTLKEKKLVIDCFMEQKDGKHM